MMLHDIFYDAEDDLMGGGEDDLWTTFSFISFWHIWSSFLHSARLVLVYVFSTIFLFFTASLSVDT